MYPLSGAAAYDRAITLFSPEGKLYQVEYATKAADMGTLGLGIVYKDGVLLAADRRVTSRLVVGGSVEKVFQVDDHIAVVASGIVGDSRALVEYARDVAEKYRFTYGEPIPIHYLAREIAKLKQLYTQYGGIRPFGVVMLIGGFYGKPRLFETVPSGALMEYKAKAIGFGKEKAMEVLEEKYKDDLSLEEATELAVETIKAALPEGEILSPKRVIMAYIDESGFKWVDQEKIKSLIG
jgi:proteasome alpha subunit